ncbi:MAG TPA: acetyl-CoA carboxylase biotin carboxyl carrier protein [Candidatus Methanoperedens sp.]|nr:acetyl-CoA carboxylase biotin carboxyl carrier protein [Candidatus Methanoperedens sp.]
MMNTKDVKDLIDLIQGTDIVEVEVERAGARIRIRRDGTAHPTAPAAAVLPAAPAAQPGPAPQATAPAQRPPVGAAAPAGVVLVTAPLVGRFYRSASPESGPYVEVGDRVRKGQVLCIIEAMKLMNQIEAEQGGTVRAILVDDGKPVEFGEPLFEIDTA